MTAYETSCMMKQLFEMKHHCLDQAKGKGSVMIRTTKWKKSYGNGLNLYSLINAPVNGPILIEKAEEILKQLGQLIYGL